ncbi:MAG: hypothetical protein RL093_784 [Pseudomonadota bacterium]|jgi:lipopolysaccharide export system protein LptA
MTMTRLLSLTIAVLALAAVPASGGAQTVGASGQAVAVSADGGEYTPEGFALRGRAEVIQGQNRLRANSINGFVTEGDLRRVEASGDVYFVTPDQTMRGDRAVYTLASDEVVVTGDVILTQGQNVLTGGRLVYNTRTETARIEGASSGRIRGVFYPQNSGN